MPSSPEHFSDRCLSIFFFTFCSILFRLTVTLFGEGDSIPDRFSGGLCGGNSPGKNLFRGVVRNAKLTETQIFRDLSIEIESSLIKLKSSLIQLERYLIQLEISIIQLKSSLIQ